MNRHLSAELAEAMNVLDADDGAGCIVITGSGSGPVFPRFIPRNVRG